MATHSSILALRIPWTEEPDWQATVHWVKKESDTTEVTCTNHWTSRESPWARSSTVQKQAMLFILWPKSAKSPALTRASSVALGKSPGFSGLPILHLQHEDAYVHAQLRPTLCDPMGYSPPGSFVHGISQAGILEWVAISSSRGSSQLRDRNCVSCMSCTGIWNPYHWASWEASQHEDKPSYFQSRCKD